ncbi:ParB/RepB/Spo0J family partition protein [Lachnospiraceae bacterium JLR.KK008]
MTMKPLEELFGISDQDLDSDRPFRMLDLDPAAVKDFPGHPFAVKMDGDMAELVESIRQRGVLHPGIARPAPGGGYEAIAGHRRKTACTLAGVATMPFMVRDYSDDEAVLIMVESNIQREQISIKEKAFSYRMHMEAQKRLQKIRPEGNPDQKIVEGRERIGGTGDTKLRRSDEILAQKTGESRNTIQRYIRLTWLIPELMDMTDAGQLPVIAASDLSYLRHGEQRRLLQYMQDHHITPNGRQAQNLKEYSRAGSVTEDVLDMVLQTEQAARTPQRIILKRDLLSQYFPEDYKVEDMESVIVSLLEKWRQTAGKKDSQQIPGQTDLATLEGGRYLP